MQDRQERGQRQESKADKLVGRLPGLDEQLGIPPEVEKGAPPITMREQRRRGKMNPRERDFRGADPLQYFRRMSAVDKRRGF